MNPAAKRFQKKFQPVADAIASVDIDQLDREIIASAVECAFNEIGDPDFRPELFRLLASDPLVPCAGHHDQPCPDKIVIRQAMHWSGNPDGSGRSDIWRSRAPYGKIRCVSCGTRQHNPEYHAALAARGE